MILLSKLKGWDEYLKGDTPFPVICNDSEMSLTFSFSAKPEGFKEFMTMPVLGFWSTEKKFLSTGSFKLKKISGREAQLVRNGQAPNNQFDEVLIRMKGIEETQKGNVAKYEIISPVEPIQEIKSQSKLIKSTPTQLVFAELNNTNKSSLQSNDLRRELFARINAYKLKEKPATDETTPTTSVFFDSQYDNPTETSYDQSKKIKKLKVLIAGSGITAPNSYVQLIIKDVLENFSEIVEVTFSGVSKSAWDRILDRDYDVRIAAVEAGTQADKWVAEMMFCTEQGISFIDPENEFCSYLRLNPKASPSDIGNTLNNLLAKHKTLIPLFNKSSIFYVGNGIDESTLSANSPLIRFDTLKSL